MAGLFSHKTLIFYIHYLLIASGLSGASVLMGVYLREYSDASQSEIGILLMSIPFLSIIIKPYFSSLADKHRAHKSYFVGGLFIVFLAYLPFIALPFFPSFYKEHQRLTWWMMATFSEIGSSGIGFVWSLGDTLAANAAIKTGGSFSRIRLIGTASWGVYGYVIGQINETPYLPKFVPVYIILTGSTLLELILVLLWDNEVFKLESQQDQMPGSMPNSIEPEYLKGIKSPAVASLAGSMRLDRQTGRALRDLITADDLNSRLRDLANSPANSLRYRGRALDLSNMGTDIEMNQQTETEAVQQREHKEGTQKILLKMIFKEDGRLIKYLMLFVMVGIVSSPFQFIFLTLDEASKERNQNFSNLAGTVIVSQAAIESIAFYVMPWASDYFKRPTLMISGFLIMVIRSSFFGYFYYTSGISLYWAVLAEWGHGIPWAIYTTLQIDIALMFANQSSLFIPKLRKLGILGDAAVIGREASLAEEASIKILLRATMNGIFAGATDGLGTGAGCLILGMVYDHFGYINMWRAITGVGIATIVLYILIELSNSRYSDRNEKYTKAQPSMDAQTLGSKEEASQQETVVQT